MYWLKPFYAFRGRTNRARFWLVSIICSVYSEAVFLIWDDSDLAQATAGSNLLLGALLWPPAVACIAVGATRLHDRNKSAGWLIPLFVIPTVLQTVAELNDLDAAVMVILEVIAGAITLWVIIELGLLRGTVGPNDYGPDPLADIAS